MSETTPGFADFLACVFRPEIAAWRGRRSLGVVFWGYGVCASFGLILLNAAALQRQQLLLQQSLIIVSVFYTMWILVAIWRSSMNADSYWGKVARGLTVAWALNSAMVLVFLQLDLVMRFIRK